MVKKFILIFAAGLIAIASRSTLFASDKINSQALGHYIMGVVYDDLGDVDKAIREYRSALSADNEVVAIHLNLATSLIKKNDLERAIEELKLVIRLDPEAVEPHAILAILYSIQNKVTLAQGEYEVALKNASKLDPNDIEVYYSLGSLYLKQDKAQEALRAFKLISVLSPADPKAHFYLGIVYEQLKNYDLCEKELKKALELNPDYAEALNYLGYEYAEWGKNLNEAEALINKALESDPNNGAYIDSLGWLYYKKGRIKEAEELLEKAGSLMEDPVIYDHLGDVYLKLNQADKAKKSWQSSLEMQPNQDQILKKLDSLSHLPSAK